VAVGVVAGLDLLPDEPSWFWFGFSDADLGERGRDEGFAVGAWSARVLPGPFPGHEDASAG
jgi:hypothetical protein